MNISNEGIGVILARSAKHLQSYMPGLYATATVCYEEDILGYNIYTLDDSSIYVVFFGNLETNMKVFQKP